jgi:predicted PurR-regulated permease PerM
MKQEAVETLVVKQVTAATAIGGSLLGWWPVILAVPAALYYIILIVEKISGRSFSELISSIFKGKQQ